MLPLEEVVAPRRAREAKRRDAFLHGRGLARAESTRHRKSAGDGERRQGARTGDLLHARACCSDEQAAAAQARPGSTTTTTTSIRRRSSTARSSPRACTRSAWIRIEHVRERRHQGVLRRHRRHGRSRATARRPDRATRQPRPLSRNRSRSTIWCKVPGTPLARHRAARPARIRAHHRGGAHHHAARPRAVYRPAGANSAKRCRRCVSSREPTRFSTATSCSPRAIRRPKPIARCSRKLGLKPREEGSGTTCSDGGCRCGQDR